MTKPKPKAPAAAAAVPASAAPLPAVAITGPVTLARVEREAHTLRQLLDAAATTVGAYDAAAAPIMDRYAPELRRHAAQIQAQQKLLLGLLEKTTPQTLWGKLKSGVLHAIKLGWRKAPDAWAWPDEAALVALIKARCTPQQQQDYLVTTTVGKKDAIPDAVRIALGIGVTRGVDAPFVNETAPSTGAALLALLARLPAADAAPAEAPRQERAA